MTDNDYDDDETGTDEPADRNVTLSRDAIRKMEKRARQAEEAEKRAAEAERRAAFAEAGIKLTDPKMSYFVKGYDGEMTAEAITAAATEAGFLAATESSDDSATRAELAGHDRISNASSGSSSRSGEAEKIAELEAAADKGPEALFAQMRAHGRTVITSR